MGKAFLTRGNRRFDQSTTVKCYLVLLQTWIRDSAVRCINTYGDLGGYKEFFEGEMIADSLKSGSPALRVELYKWLAERLPQSKYRSPLSVSPVSLVIRISRCSEKRAQGRTAGVLTVHVRKLRRPER